MRGRRWMNATITVERGSTAAAGSTLQQHPAYTAVVGMTSIPAGIYHESSSPVAVEIGMIVGEAWAIIVDPDTTTPAGANIKEGDRIKKTDTGETFTVRQAKLAHDGFRGRTWALACERKTA